MVGASVVVAVVGAMVMVVLACVVPAVVVLDKTPKDRKERKTPLISTFFYQNLHMVYNIVNRKMGNILLN